eukprot:613545-Amphidinium_carterae.1
MMNSGWRTTEATSKLVVEGCSLHSRPNRLVAKLATEKCSNDKRWFAKHMTLSRIRNILKVKDVNDLEVDFRDACQPMKPSSTPNDYLDFTLVKTNFENKTTRTYVFSTWCDLFLNIGVNGNKAGW